MAYTTFPANLPPHQSSPGEEVTPRINLAKFGDGYVQASEDGINNIETMFQVLWENEDYGNINVIVEFLRATGGARPFYWTPPLESVASLWYCPKGWKRSNYRANSCNLSATFERWFGATQ